MAELEVESHEASVNVVEIYNELKLALKSLTNNKYSCDFEKDLLERAIKQKRELVENCADKIPVSVLTIVESLINNTLSDVLLLCIIEHKDFKNAFRKIYQLGISLKSAYYQKNEHPSFLYKEILKSIEENNSEKAEKIDELLPIEPFLKKVIVLGRSGNYLEFHRSLEKSLGFMCGEGNEMFEVCCEINGCDSDSLQRLIKKVARSPISDIIRVYNNFKLKNS